MFLVKAKTIIQIEISESQAGWFNWASWRPYTTTEDQLYDKHEVWDAVAVHNDREDVPLWARHNILEHNKVILKRKGKYALVNAKDIEFLD